jgi:hypothetical protein
MVVFEFEVSRRACGCGGRGFQPDPASLPEFQCKCCPHPDLVGSNGLGHDSQAVGCDRLNMVAIGGKDALTAPLAAAEAGLVHDRGNAIATAAATLFAEFHQNAQTPIRLPTEDRDGLNFPGQEIKK